MNVITINGVRIEVEGNNVSVINGKVKVDGKVIHELSPNTTTIEWNGDLANLTTDQSVNCEDVEGNVSAGGSVNCEDVEGNVSAGGSVNCGDVNGHIKAGGSVCSM